MLLGVDARGADQSGQTVGEKPHEWAGILVGDNTRDGPGGGRMFGRKRGPALEEFSVGVVEIGAFAPGCVFDCFHRRETVDRRLAAEESGLTLVLVAGAETQQIKPGRAAGHGIGSVIGNVFVLKKGAGRIRQMPADVAIGRK